MRPRTLVVGGGIAGAGAAYHLAPHAEVTLVDQEASLAYHTTGRSAALFFENYGAGPIRPLSRGSRGFLASPPDGLTDHPLLSPRGALTIAAEQQLARLGELQEEGLAAGADVRRIGPEAARKLCPALRPTAAVEALWEPDAADIDVAGLHQAFVRGLRRAGGTIRTTAPLREAVRTSAGWRVDLGDGVWEGDLIVNAAGAWGDEVAARCGLAPLGLQPLRRTAFMVAGPEGSSGWPLVVDAEHSFYFKADGDQLLCSPADETPSDPCDARPEELDVAIAIDRITAATDLEIRHVRSQWAGLRTFMPDRAMAIGPDPAAPGFVWLVGQGGTGIQTAPAAGALAAALALDAPLPEVLVAAEVDVAALSPARFRTEAL